jgi:ubiquinol-cytochrome c reductase cytochrome c1 subunit
MTMIKKLLCALALLITCNTASASGGEFPLDRAPNRINELTSLQNGAKLFVNYCLNCHSASAMRYNKLNDIGLTDEQIRTSLLFTGEKVGDLMMGSVSVKDGKRWFGVMPPDLSVIARAKSANAGPTGSDYIYTYLRTYYRDTSKPTGWDNLAYPASAMPHILYERQGPRELTTVVTHQHAAPGSKGPAEWERVTTTYDSLGYATSKAEKLTNYRGHASTEHKFKAIDASRTSAYDNDIADLTAFMTWMSEPVQQKRKQIGVFVLLFLGVFFVVAWRLNASYWKHVK